MVTHLPFLVIAGAMVHYHGIIKIANYRLTLGDCTDIVAI